MLPFLKNKQNQGIAGLIIKQRAPDEQAESEQPEDKDAAIHACSQDLITAIHNRDTAGVSEAIRAAFEILDSMPHDEGDHVEPHSYDAQNIKAGNKE